MTNTETNTETGLPLWVCALAGLALSVLYLVGSLGLAAACSAWL
jgi:hypothetical protein